MISFYDYIKGISSYRGCKEQEVVEFCDKYDSCAVCLKTQLEKHDAEVREKAVNEFRTKVSKDIEFFTEKVKAQVYDLVLEVENFAERMKEHDD